MEEGRELGKGWRWKGTREMMEEGRELGKGWREGDNKENNWREGGH